VSSGEADGLAVVVVAAGESRRLGTDKLFVSVGGRPVLSWALRALEASPQVSLIVLVLAASNLERGRRLVAREHFAKVREVVVGGARRQDSVWNGLQPLVGFPWVAIHDGARPFVTPDLLAAGWEAARAAGAAIAAVRVKDTIKRLGSANLIQETPPRAELWAAQTPQIFQTTQLIAAYRANAGRDVTDDAELLERIGQPCVVYPGSYENLKITTAEDLALARAIARQRRGQEIIP
jgi:2-C-methyl-D-erythritol 4-phosphate cytidylyltransferase